MRRLISLVVEDLLDQFDHRIEFPSDWPFVILYGPNGVGKTKMLELVAALFDLSVPRLAQVPFSRALLAFDDGSRLIVERGGSAALAIDGLDEMLRASRGTIDVDGPTIRIILEPPGVEPVIWDTSALGDEVGPQYLRVIEREFGLRRIGPDAWRDARTRQVLSRHDVQVNYGDVFRGALFGGMQAPDSLREFCNEVNVHLIETQRLLTLEAAGGDARRPGGERAQRPTVVEFGQDLARRLGEALARNSRTTQQLDRSFPRRIMAGGTPDYVTDSLIREKYVEQNELRSQLASIAVLESEADLPLPDRDLKDWERGVLWTYLQDTDEKLATFSTLLAKVQLLRQIVNSRFLYKEMHIDGEDGFRFVTAAGHEVDARSLSSGEQHELVLAYDLLFNVAPDSLVLIDEPEISLHVSWQQEFLTDIARISELVPLRFVVATHSPQVIHKWWSRAIALTPDVSVEADD